VSLQATIALARGDFALDLSLGVEPGQTVALLGPNGSGKSTLVEALAGLLPIERGEIVLDGVTLERPADGIRVRPQDRPVGVMFQGLWLFPHLSVRDNVAYGLWARGQTRHAARDAVRPLLERLDLVDLAERRPGALSGGEAQRVALTRALAPQPRLLLLDEPLSALDLARRPRTRALLQEVLAAFSGPRMLITHDPLDALLLADHLVVLENGRVAQAGPTDEVRRHPSTRYVATLAGVNLLEGTLADTAGRRVLRAGGLELTVDDAELAPGPALATIRPGAVELQLAGDSGGQANAWDARVEALELESDRVRVRLDRPEGLTAELAGRDLALRRFAPGTPLRASVRPKDIVVYRP